MPDQPHPAQHDEPRQALSAPPGSVALLPCDFERGKYKAIRGGEKAGYFGVPKDRNPYKNKDRAAWWVVGWEQGKALAEWGEQKYREALASISQNDKVYHVVRNERN